MNKARVQKVLAPDGSLYGYRFNCPGCLEPHVIPVLPTDRGWVSTGTVERPTFSPSILVRYRRTNPEDIDAQPFESTCHSFVRDGQIQFLGDCTHALANQTVDLPWVT